MENQNMTTLAFNFEVLSVKSLNNEELPCYQIQSTDKLKVILKQPQFIQKFTVTDCSEIELTPSETKKVFTGSFKEEPVNTQGLKSAAEILQRHHEFIKYPSDIALLAMEFFKSKRIRATINPIGTYIVAEVAITPLNCITTAKSRIQIDKENRVIQSLMSFRPKQ
ncbi:hypothetical protein [Pseudoalteromonas sp. APM04]|uniref:hypothetical protein n=1 Tax=Pseudoalteromonas sp. APM04 TaxID=2699396 RepID=UPI001FB4B2B5|nr:hypothetical protein [Pseudoalteromonas sp. APM04]UOB72661.1 hypothetical protein MTP24_11110 [Pseudoalteromonas sp. APM04]